MEEILKLRRLVDYGIPMTVLARECHCTPQSIKNYIEGRSIPNGSKVVGIKDGLKQFSQYIKQITEA